MRKLAIVLIVALIPAAFLSAEISIGGGAFARTSTVINALESDVEGGPLPAIMQDMNYDGEVRVKLWIFRADATVMLFQDGSIIAPVDGMLSLDLLFFRLGLGAGANFAYADGQFGLWQEGSEYAYSYNVKATLDFLLGKHLSIGVEAICPLMASDFEYVFGPTFWKTAPTETSRSMIIGAYAAFRI